MATVIASAKGQIVIPKKEREKVGIKPGLRVVVQAVGDHIEIRPLPEKSGGLFLRDLQGGAVPHQGTAPGPSGGKLGREDKKGV